MSPGKISGEPSIAVFLPVSCGLANTISCHLLNEPKYFIAIAPSVSPETTLCTFDIIGNFLAHRQYNNFVSRELVFKNKLIHIINRTV